MVPPTKSDQSTMTVWDAPHDLALSEDDQDPTFHMGLVTAERAEPEERT